MTQPSRSLFRTTALQWAAVVLSIAAATAVRWLLDPVLGIRLPFVTYFVAIYFLAWSTSLWPAIFALVLAAWTADFFFVAPRYTWYPHWQNDVDYVGTALYFIVGGTGIAICEAMRRARHEAAEQAERLRTTLASIGDAVITTDTKGRITGLNPVAEKLTGWTTNKAIGQPLDVVFRIVNEQSRQTVENPATRALREGVVVGLANHTLLIAKDGTERPIDDSASPIRCAEGEIVGCVLVFRDVTERRLAEKELRESEARKAAILETALDCIITIDHEGKILEFNPAAEKTFGFSRQHVLGRKMAELIVPPAFREQHYQGLVHFLSTGNGPVLNKRIQMPALRADNTEIPVELSIAAIRRQDAPPIFTAYLCDVTAPLRTEKRRAARLAVTQIVAEATTVKDAARQIIQAVCEGLGWDVGSMWQVDPHDNVLRCVDVWHQSGLKVDEYEALTRKTAFSRGVGLPGRIWLNGQSAWIPDVVKDTNFPRAPVADRAGLHGAFGFPVVIGSEFFGVIEFFSHEIREPDVDLLEMMTTIGSQVGSFIERKRSEDALRRVAADLSEADRRKNEFLATLAHELRNPLAPIRNALHIMRRTGDEGDSLNSASAMMERQIGQMVRLVDDLLDVSRISRGKIDLRCEPVELASVVHHAVEAVESTIAQAGHELSVRLPAEPIYVYADATRIAQVIGNLLNNACKFTNSNGQIEVGVSVEWRVASEERVGGPSKDRAALSRAQGVAGVDETSGAVLPRDQGLSQGRDVWNDKPDSPRGSIDSSQHRRGAGTATHQGVSESSKHSEGVADGSGNTSITQSPSRTTQSGNSGCASIIGGRNQPDAIRTSTVPPGQTDERRLITDRNLASLGNDTLTTSHSPLATSFAVITVKDNGIGIAADQQSRIFDMFAQVDSSLERSESGLGIGLTLVRNLVNMHAGSVEVRSTGIGHGSEFVVRLPVMSADERIAHGERAASLSAATAARCSASMASRRILIVDDNEDAATSLATLLTLDGHETRTAYDGLEALEIAETFQPEVLFLDIGLPKLNGYEVARRIRNQRWGDNMMLVALTGWGQEDDRRRSSEAGFDAHLVKPVDPSSLMRILAGPAPAQTDDSPSDQLSGGPARGSI